MSSFKIYHNPRCSKSRQTLSLLQENGVEPEVVLYLTHAPSREEIAKLSELLGVRPIEMTRTKETLFKELGLSKDDSDDAILDALAAHPKLIERPIVVRDGELAVIGRPPENALELI